MPAKRTPFYPLHREMGARFIEFGGWEMPVQFSGIIKEHLNTRKNVSLFDTSHMGEFIVAGKNAYDLLQYVCTNDIDLMKPRDAQYSPLCYENGTVVDDIFIYCYSKERYRLIVNASNRDKDLKWFQKHSIRFEDVRVEDDSDTGGRLALQGPKSQDVLQTLVKEDLDKIRRFQFIEADVDGIRFFIARTGYTGEDGFEISFPRDKCTQVWNLLMDHGKEFGILPAGLGARDTLRLEASYSLYGHEISDQITPIEGGVEFVIKPSKKEDYIGRKILEHQLNTFINRKIIAIKALEKAIFRHGQEVYEKSGKILIGKVTSGTFSPTFKVGIALALINSRYKVIGEEVLVKVRNKLIRGKIVNRPFYPYHPRDKK
ncbi:MAG: glycine cleavage system aminomethyltransferase GcvT [Promethearchaeota archaeon]